MVRFSIPAATLLAMSIGAFGADEAAHAQEPQRNGKYVRNGVESDGKPQLSVLQLLKGSEGKQLRASTTAEQPNKAKGKGKGPRSNIFGTYAVVMREGTAQGWANGVIRYDGWGEMTGSLTFNTPDDQTVFTSDVSGTYDLEDDENGLRTQEWTYETTPIGELTLASRLSIQSLVNGIVRNVYGTQIVPSQFYPGGHVQFTMYRRPARGFQTSDLEGVWNVRGIASGLNNDETGASGRITFLPGQPGEPAPAEGFLVVDDPQRISAPTPQFNGPKGPDGKVRATFNSPVLGEYTVFDDGTCFFEMNNQLLTFIMLDMPCVITELRGGRVQTIECFTYMNSPASLSPLSFTWTRLR